MCDCITLKQFISHALEIHICHTIQTPFLLFKNATTQIFGLLMVRVNLKAEWKSVSLEFGALCVMISGMQMTQLQHADSWDIPQKVSSETVCITPSENNIAIIL